MSSECYESAENFARVFLSPAVGRLAAGCSGVALVGVSQGGKVLTTHCFSATHLYQIFILLNLAVFLGFSLH